jgi:hypothetical protein
LTAPQKAVFVFVEGNLNTRRCQVGLTCVKTVLPYIVYEFQSSFRNASELLSFGVPKHVATLTSYAGGAVAWIVQLAFDVFIVFLTVCRTILSWREDGRTGPYAWSLGDLMFRDGECRAPFICFYAADAATGAVYFMYARFSASSTKRAEYFTQRHFRVKSRKYPYLLCMFALT